MFSNSHLAIPVTLVCFVNETVRVNFFFFFQPILLLHSYD